MYNELFFSVASKWREISLPVKICTKCKSTHGSYCDSEAVQEAGIHAEGSRTTPENPIVAGEFVSQEKKAIIFIFYKETDDIILFWIECNARSKEWKDIDSILLLELKQDVFSKTIFKNRNEAWYSVTNLALVCSKQSFVLLVYDEWQTAWLIFKIIPFNCTILCF